MRDHQSATVEYVVADQPVGERAHVGPERLVLPAELIKGLGQSVTDLDLATVEGPEQLGLVIARDAQRITAGDHAHHQPQHPGGVRTPIDQVAEEDHPPMIMMRPDRPTMIIPVDGVAQLAQQDLQLPPATVHVADHVERTGLVAAIVVQPGPHDGRPRRSRPPT